MRWFFPLVLDAVAIWMVIAARRDSSPEPQLRHRRRAIVLLLLTLPFGLGNGILRIISAFTVDAVQSTDPAQNFRLVQAGIWEAFAIMVLGIILPMMAATVIASTGHGR